METEQTRILVVIDPTSPQQLALVKAQLIAKLGNCHIHAFMCIYKDMAESGGHGSHEDFKRQRLQQAEEWLRQEMRSCDTSGLSYSTEIVWDSNWVKALVQAIEQARWDLVVKSSFHHSKAQRFFSETADYYLMRHCSCPILFTHQSQEWQADRILACVDLESGDSAHARLNEAILANARALAEIIGMELYLGSAYATAIHSEQLPIKARQGDLLAGQLGEYFGLGAEHVLLRKGETVATLRAICDEIEPSIVVIGTLARRGVSGKLIGNTAEKLLDAIDADLLTVC